jgi:hypothetical protein
MRPGALRAATAKAAAKLGKMRTLLTAGEKPDRKRTAAISRAEKAQIGFLFTADLLRFGAQGAIGSHEPVPLPPSKAPARSSG